MEKEGHRFEWLSHSASQAREVIPHKCNIKGTKERMCAKEKLSIAYTLPALAPEAEGCTSLGLSDAEERTDLES
jgi:hypothetical protein